MTSHHVRSLILIVSVLCVTSCARSYELLSTGANDAGSGPGADLGGDDGVRADLDAGTRTDLGTVTPPAGRCAPQDARYVRCDTAACFVESYRWNGFDCESISGCSCVGEDCDDIFSLFYDCRDAYENCPSRRCEETEGHWYPLGGCGAECGHFTEANCVTPIDVCVCRSGQTFDAVQGCVDDARCDASDLCLGSGGTLHARCNTTCGVEGSDCDPGCDCGPYMSWFADLGCASYGACPSTIEAECTETGGTVVPGCSFVRCGAVQPTRDGCDETFAMCDCGPTKSYVDGRGCVDDRSCPLPMGSSCDVSAGPPCASGLECCGNSPSSGPYTCVAPLCEDTYNATTGCPY